MTRKFEASKRYAQLGKAKDMTNELQL